MVWGDPPKGFPPKVFEALGFRDFGLGFRGPRV